MTDVKHYFKCKHCGHKYCIQLSKICPKCKCSSHVISVTEKVVVVNTPVELLNVTISLNETGTIEKQKLNNRYPGLEKNNGNT